MANQRMCWVIRKFSDGYFTGFVLVAALEWASWHTCKFELTSGT